MESVIYIDKHYEEFKDAGNTNPVEFTHYMSIRRGWIETVEQTDNYVKIVYLGRCDYDGDMFAAYSSDSDYPQITISIFKGHLNSAKY
jgi:hypothetical protein